LPPLACSKGNEARNGDKKKDFKGDVSLGKIAREREKKKEGLGSLILSSFGFLN